MSENWLNQRHSFCRTEVLAILRPFLKVEPLKLVLIFRRLEPWNTFVSPLYF